MRRNCPVRRTFRALETQNKRSPTRRSKSRAGRVSVTPPDERGRQERLLRLSTKLRGKARPRDFAIFF